MQININTIEKVDFLLSACQAEVYSCSRTLKRYKEQAKTFPPQIDQKWIDITNFKIQQWEEKVEVGNSIVKELIEAKKDMER